MSSVSGQHMGACSKGLQASTTIVIQQRVRGRGKEEEERREGRGMCSGGGNSEFKDFPSDLPGNKLVVIDMDSPKAPRSLFLFL